MKVFRFMSIIEFNKYKDGIKLENNTIHDGKTNSVGFCFLDADEYTPEEAMHFLSGIVTFDVCAVFETKKELKKTYGVYAKPIDPTSNLIIDLINLFNGYNDRFTANEYCTSSYSKDDMKLIKYTKNIWKQYQPREEQKNLKWEVV